MPNQEKMDSGRAREVLAGRVLLLAFGFGVLGFLVAMDHANWFSIQPGTGTSVAMSRAAATGTEFAAQGTVVKR